MRVKISNDGNGSAPRHLDDADMVSYLDGELERVEHDDAHAHLEGCWICRSRLLAVENSIENFLRARKRIIPTDLPPSNIAVAQFRRRLAQHQYKPTEELPSGLEAGYRPTVLASALKPILTYKKAAFASLIAIVVVAALIIDPFKWNSVSADSLLTRASAYESLNELPSGKVIRVRARFDRINLATKVEKNLGHVETDADSLSGALYVSRDSRSGQTQKRALPDRDKPANIDPFFNDFDADTAKYLAAQGWLPQVSVSLYKRLIAGRGLNGNDGASAKRNRGAYELHHAFSPSHPSHIAETVMTLNAQTYAPQTVSIFTIEGDEQFEYRFTRTSIESIERTPEIAKLFEAPASENSKTTISSASTPNTLNPRPKTLAPTPGPDPLTPSASADLEVEVLRLLHEAGADLGEQVSVSRSAGGPVRVSGIVETDQRKNEILRALQLVAGNPAVRIEVKTVAEAMAERRDKQNGLRLMTVEGVEVAVDTFPAYQDLRARMSDEEARVFAARMISRSHSAMRYAWALRRLMTQFSASDLAKLQPEAHAKWIALIQSHARAFEAESRSLREQLQPIFRAAAEPGAGAGQISNDAELIGAVERLVALASTNYEVVRSAFTVTRERAAITALKTPQFWNSLRGAEAVAASIQTAR